MNRPGEIWRLDQMRARSDGKDLNSIDPTKDSRLYVILGTCRLYGQLRVNVVPIQTPDPHILTKVRIYADKTNNLDWDSWIVCGQIMTVSWNHFVGPKVGSVDNETFQQIKSMVGFQLHLTDESSETLPVAS